MIARGTGVLTTTIAPDGHGRPTTTSDGATATWSPDGELTRLASAGGAHTDFAYDGLGRLTQVTLPDGRIGRYRYDALGHRTAVRLDGALTRRYVYGTDLFPKARVDASGDVLERYVYASRSHVPDLIVRRDGTRLRLVTDATGSVRAVVDADSGAVVQRLTYDAYGRVLTDSAPGTQPFGYKGALSDPVAEGAGLIWMGVRAYQPTLARFTTPDPAGLASGFNQHDALGGDPINLIDADGQFPIALAALGSPFGIGLGLGLVTAYSVWKNWDALQAAFSDFHCPNIFHNEGSDGNNPDGSPVLDPADFAGKTPDEVHEAALGAGLIPQGPDPKYGQGSYTDPVTGEQRVLSHPLDPHGGHLHVNNPAGERLGIDGSPVPNSHPDAHLPIGTP